ncbi:hypothetical protein [Henriciella pelagia]|uniref:hypothetical protein n=1 Tax=Henriciella pelagia TaxID=1977912 RepID=UPI00351720DB
MPYSGICRFLEIAPRISIEGGLIRFYTRRYRSDGSMFETGECFVMPLDQSLTTYANLGAVLVKAIENPRAAEVVELHATQPPGSSSAQAR